MKDKWKGILFFLLIVVILIVHENLPRGVREATEYPVRAILSAFAAWYAYAIVRYKRR